MIVHVSENIILKIAPRDPGCYDVIDVFVQDGAQKLGSTTTIMRDF